MPGLTHEAVSHDRSPDAVVLQWRAGHVPGLTGPSPSWRVGSGRVASMEGRARARPDTRRTCATTAATIAASMEGRARARPDCTVIIAIQCPAWRPFNGGPGTCPA